MTNKLDLSSIIDIVVVCLTGLIIFGAVVGAVFVQLLRPSRKLELQSYWDAFGETDGCENALTYYKRSLSISNFYGIPFSEIGCPDRKVFHEAAMNGLYRSIERSDGVKALGLRQDLTLLTLIHATQGEKAAAANTFVTAKKQLAS